MAARLILRRPAPPLLAPPLVSVGLDLSATSAGVVALEAQEAGPPCLLHEEIVAVKGRGMQRAQAVAARVAAVTRRWPPGRVAIEGYASRRPGALIPLVEVGTAVRLELRAQGLRWLEPAPTQLKLFALGKGAGDKDQVMLQVFKRWGHEALNNDTADAYVLACIGLGHAGKLKGMTQSMLEVLGTLKVI